MIVRINPDSEQHLCRTARVPAAILVSPDEFESWRETMALRFDRESMDEIQNGITALKEGRASLYTLEEFFQE